MKQKYWIAFNNGVEGWALEEFNSLEELKERLQNEPTYSPYRIFKELELEIKDETHNIP